VAIGATRWMTYVDMARRFILWRWAIQNAMQEVVKLKPIGETPIDWSFSQDQLDILSHFVIVGDAAQEVLIRLQGSLAPTISCLLYNYVVLQRNMVQWAGDDSELCPQIQLLVVLQARCHQSGSEIQPGRRSNVAHSRASRSAIPKAGVFRGLSPSAEIWQRRSETGVDQIAARQFARTG
jgi:hypothetical protein